MKTREGHEGHEEAIGISVSGLAESVCCVGAVLDRFVR
jgi:hypothetical protein